MPRRKSVESAGDSPTGRLEESPEYRLFENIPDLYSLSPEQEQVLVKEIERHKGAAVGVVHAFYNWEDDQMWDPDGIQKLERRYRKGLRLKDLPPIFIFCEAGQEDACRARIYKMKVQNLLVTERLDHNIITIIPTWPNSPTPYVWKKLPKLTEGSRFHMEKQAETEESWKIINRKFAGLGIKKFFLVGEYMIVGDPMLPNKLGGRELRPANPFEYLKQRYGGDETKAGQMERWLHGCLSATADRLSGSFKVKILPATYPSTEKDLRWLEKKRLNLGKP